MNRKDEARVAKLEKQVGQLRKAYAALLEAAEVQGDPVADSFKRFQQRADKQMGRA